MCQLAECGAKQRAARRKAGFWYKAVPGGFCVAVQGFRWPRTFGDMRGHPPSPLLEFAGSHEPFGKVKRGFHRLAARDAPAEFRAFRAHDQLSSFTAFDPHVGRGVRQHALTPAIDRKAEFGGKTDGSGRERALRFNCDQTCLVARLPEWRDDKIAPRFGVGIGIEQSELREPLDERGKARLANTPDLQIGAAGQIDQAVAVPLTQLGNTRRLHRIDPAEWRADANQEPVARFHRPPRAGTPALDRDRAHDAALNEAAIELRRVFQSEASCSRTKQASRAASAGAFSCAMNERTRSSPSVAS